MRSGNPAADTAASTTVVARVSRAKRDRIRWLFSYHLIPFFPPTAVADLLGEGDTVVAGLVA
jgi:hypothetical protein